MSQERIAELEREIVRIETEDNWDDDTVFKRHQNLRSELSRLRNEDGGEECPCCGGSGYERYLGRDNSEEVIDCSLCKPPPPQPDALREALEKVKSTLGTIQNLACLPERLLSVDDALNRIVKEAAEAIGVIDAALSSAPTQSDERAGLELAAKWHEEQARKYEATAQESDEREDEPSMTEGDCARFIAETHRSTAASLRSLASGGQDASAN